MRDGLWTTRLLSGQLEGLTDALDGLSVLASKDNGGDIGNPLLLFSEFEEDLQQFPRDRRSPRPLFFYLFRCEPE
jgi:hypothetical protein